MHVPEAASDALVAMAVFLASLDHSPATFLVFIFLNPASIVAGNVAILTRSCKELTVLINHLNVIFCPDVCQLCSEVILRHFFDKLKLFFVLHDHLLLPSLEVLEHDKAALNFLEQLYAFKSKFELHSFKFWHHDIKEHVQVFFVLLPHILGILPEQSMIVDLKNERVVHVRKVRTKSVLFHKVTSTLGVKSSWCRMSHKYEIGFRHVSSKNSLNFCKHELLGHRKFFFSLFDNENYCVDLFDFFLFQEVFEHRNTPLILAVAVVSTNPREIYDLDLIKLANFWYLIRRHMLCPVVLNIRR